MSKARISLPRQVGRVCSVIIGAHVTMVGLITLFSRLSTDTSLQEHWDYSTPVLRQRKNYFRLWEPGYFIPALSSDERECLDAWISVFRVQPPPLISRNWSPNVLLQDSQAMFDGLGELRDSVYALSFCVHSVDAYLQEVRRERQKDVTFLHCKVMLDVMVRIPFTQRVLRVYQLPSTSTLELQYPPYSPKKLHITAVEHRWWGGRIWSAQTGSVRTPWGDIGDIVRRYNGFALATAVTKETRMEERLLNARATAREKRLQRRHNMHLEAPPPPPPSDDTPNDPPTADSLPSSS